MILHDLSANQFIAKRTSAAAPRLAHPLWFGVLLAGHTLVLDRYLLAVGLGLSAITQWRPTHSIVCLGEGQLHGGLLAMVFAMLCVSS